MMLDPPSSAPMRVGVPPSASMKMGRTGKKKMKPAKKANVAKKI